MDRNEYNRICQCKSVKEIWRLLEITHKGTNQVKESKINLLVHSYELFFMKENETIVEMTYGIGGPIISTVRGVEILLDLESIYHIFDIAPIGLRVYKSKIWPTVLGFEPREVVQRIFGFRDAQGMGKPLTHSLTMISRVLHHMICSILLPRGGH